MNFLVLSNDYTGTVVTKRLLNEQHTVYYCNQNHRNNGISTCSNIYVAIANHIDAAIICNTGFTKEYNILQQKKIPTLGGTEFQEKVELDRLLLSKLCKQYKIRLLKSTTNIDHPLSTEVWFSNGEPLYQYFNYIKQTKFLAGDLGPDVDAESVVFWSNKTREVESVKRIFENGLFDILKSIKYTGVFAVDSYISKDDKYPYIFKVIPRLQAPVLESMLELYKNNFGDLIVNLLNNRKLSILLESKVSISVAVSKQPYPYLQEGFIKYVTASDDDWKIARKKIGKQLRDMQLQEPQLQYRIDGGIQAENISLI